MSLFTQVNRIVTAATDDRDGQARDCPHMTLAPRWDSAADMGIPERVMAYRCDACYAMFSPEEGRQLVFERARLGTAPLGVSAQGVRQGR